MTLQKLLIAVLALALGTGPLAVAAFGQARDIFIPLLVYRTGPYAPSGIPIANGFVDYFTLLNERDGGINGVKVTWEECETQYDTKQGVECYERLKGKGALVVNPYSTGISYQLIPKAPVDKLTVFSMGYGMSASSDGRTSSGVSQTRSIPVVRMIRDWPWMTEPSVSRAWSVRGVALAGRT